MTRGARIHRLHSRDKTRRNFGENHAERADLSSCTLSAPKNANDGAGARVMIFSEGARARCAPSLLLLRLHGVGVDEKSERNVHCLLKTHGIIIMKDCETARQGAQNLTTHTSVKTPSSTRRAAQAAGEDQDDIATQMCG